MKRLSMVLVFFLMPSFALVLVWAFPDNQGLYFGTGAREPWAFADRVLVKTVVEKVLSSPPLVEQPRHIEKG